MLGLLALIIAGSPAAQTTYPEKPVHLVVGFPPGSAPDTVARVLGEKFAAAWGKAVTIENVPGAAANIAADRIAKAAPDGYTLGLMGQSIVVNPSLYKLAYDTVKDFAPVSQVAVSPYILVVHNAVPAKNIKDLVALAKAQPGGLTFASGGSGSATHIAAELFKSAASIDIRHIPYKGVVAAIPDVLGGRVTMMFSPMVGVLPLAREGKLRALAVTSLKRSSAAPELSTIAESGYPGFEFTIWYGLLAPGKTPATIVRKLHLETV
jgi:tripartite-type tricarboxylate transporter receptor subunit TctC